MVWFRYGREWCALFRRHHCADQLYYQILVELVKLANLIVIISKSLASMGRVGQVLDMESS